MKNKYQTEKILITKNDLKEILWETLNSDATKENQYDYGFRVYANGYLSWFGEETTANICTNPVAPIYESNGYVLKIWAAEQGLLNDEGKLRDDITDDEKDHFFETSLNDIIHLHSRAIDWEKREVITWKNNIHTCPGQMSERLGAMLWGAPDCLDGYNIFSPYDDYDNWDSIADKAAAGKYRFF